ncbi:SDR family oxidoreductase [Streptomyces fimicarius]|uniref:SDR family oxidoreductase n=1 Tax=Streptomyces griseus TaxID=1911 RepID=UPI0036914538
MSMARKVALVTGGAKGVGRSISVALADRGVHVIVNCFHSTEAAEDTVLGIRRAGGSAEVIRASVAQEDAVRSMFTQVSRDHGGLDILVNNAARGALSGFGELTEKQWEQSLAVNLHGARRCAREAAPLIAARGGGTIVNLSSIGAGHVLDSYSAMGVSKASVEALTRYLAVEYAPLGIRVNTASASMIDNATLHLFPEAGRLAETIRTATPLGRLAHEKDLCDIVLFLSGDHASFITGQTIIADGGLSLGYAMLSPRAPSSSPDGTDDVTALTSDSVEALAKSVPSDATGADELVAVVGMGLAVPGASGPEEFWELLNSPGDAFTPPQDRFRANDFFSTGPNAPDKTYARVAGYLRNFRPHPRLASWTGQGKDTGALWLRHSLLQASDDVTLAPDTRTQVYVGAWPGGSQSLAETLVTGTALAVAAQAGQDPGPLREVLRRRFPRAVTNIQRTQPVGVVRDAIDGVLPPGTGIQVVDTACASSLFAVDLGAKALLAGECDVAFCGGVEVLEPTNSVLFAKLGGLSHAGQVRAFDQDADGTLFSDGASMVALKLLSRAQHDGDTVLGVLSGFGAATDGRGKSIAAPNPAGQRRAVTRARAVNTTAADSIDWVIAHATGTPAGDRSELSVLAELAPQHGYICTGTKSTVGHTGWAAGTVSLIHALLALRHEKIPAQQRFSALPEQADQSRIRVATEPVPFPSDERRPRTVGISAFGFGGTNGHLLITDRPTTPAGSPARSAPAARPADIVVVGWSAHLPGEPSRDAVARWLHGEGPAPNATFPRPYPLPLKARLRLPPRTLRAIDPCQVMGLQCALRFSEENGPLWSGLEETTGVIATAGGVPQAFHEAALRCYADGLVDTLHAAHPDAARVLATHLEQVKEHTPPLDEDSQPGVMTNVIPSRIAALFDLHGPTMTVDAEPDATLKAFDTARAYLRTGELDLALVLSVSGGPSPWAATPGQKNTGPAEGAFLIALATAEQAREKNWPMLARLGDHPPDSGPASLPTGYDRSALNILATSARAAKPTAKPSAGQPVQRLLHASGSSLPPRRLQPYRLEWVKRAAPQHAPSPDSSVPPDSVVILGPGIDPDALGPALRKARAIITTGSEPGWTSSNVLPLPDLSSAEARTLLEQAVADAVPQITLIADLTGTDPAIAPDSSLLHLHDLLFHTARSLWPRRNAHHTLAALLTGITPPLPPDAALFTGMLRSLAWEEPRSRVFSVLTDGALGPSALRALASERLSPCPPPVIWYHDTTRHTEILTPAPATEAPAPLILAKGAVIVAVGGGGGIVSELLHRLGPRHDTSLWVLGRTAIDLSQQDEALLASVQGTRTDLLRALRNYHPHHTPRQTLAEADRLLRVQRLRRAMEQLDQQHGRVRYLPCDILDENAVTQAAATIRAEEDHLDLVIHGAGLPGARSLSGKSLLDHQRVRDTKVLGYRHLKQAFAPDAPRRWWNIGSMLGPVIGLPGEEDYCAGNHFLDAAARISNGTETTARSLLWAETGLYAEPARQEHASRVTGLTALPTHQAVEQLLRQLADTAEGENQPLHLGPTERRIFFAERLHRPPDTLTARGTPPPRHAFFDPSALRQHPERVDLPLHTHDHPYLHDHLVDGKPTLAGTFMLAIAAEAAQTAAPGHIVTGFRDADFTAFVRPLTGRQPRRFHATLTPPHKQKESRVVVHVTIASLPSTPSQDATPRKHFSCTVLLDPPGAAPTPSATTPPHPSSATHPVADPYYAENSPVSLRGIFRNTTDSRHQGTQTRAHWLPTLPHDVLARFTVPALLMCATLRQAALPPTASGRQHLYVPRHIAKVDLHLPTANDVDLIERYPDGATLHSTDQQTFDAWSTKGDLLLTLTGCSLISLEEQRPNK